MKAVLLLLIAYLIGAIPFGYLVPKMLKIDIRRHGSGNIGATNVFRTLGPKYGILVFALDFSKGLLPVLLAKIFFINPWAIIMVGFMAILGHTYPVYLKFKGGKGAATGLGVLCAIAPDIFIGSILVACLIVYASRTISLASIITVLFTALAFTLLGRPLPYIIIVWIVTGLIIHRHIPNIKRIMAGTEPKIGASK